MGDFHVLSVRIKQLRKEIGLTQRKFSKMVGCTAATLSAYENGSKSPSLEIIKRIAENCNVSIDWLIGLSNKKETEPEIETYSDIFKSPFFTAILAHILIGSEEKFRINFFIGFLIAMAGIMMISLNGARLELNPMGDLLALLAAFVWAIYSILSKKISGFGYPVVLSTRRTFFYGILFMIPAAWIFDLRLDLSGFAEPKNLLNLLYLGLGASALCFVTWNFAVKKLGAVKTSIYIYMVPVITVVTSVLILGEKITWMSGLGVIFTLMGLFLSEMKIPKRK